MQKVCLICNKPPKKGSWECSHVDCPNRKILWDVKKKNADEDFTYEDLEFKKIFDDYK